MNPLPSNKLNALTGLRAVAALAVFAAHFMGIMDCKVVNMPVGGIAVSFFFVLSGFILVYVYKDKLRQTGVRKFYFTRCARIWPLHIVCLFLIAAMLPKFLPPTQWPWLRSAAHWSLLQAWYPSANWSECYNGVAWSISAEAFFYLMFPVLLLGGTRQFILKYAGIFVMTFVAMVVMAYTFDPVSPIKEIANASLDPKKVVHFFPAFRLLEFVTGMATGMVYLHRHAADGDETSARTGVAWLGTAKATVVEVIVLAFAIGGYQLYVASGLFGYLHGIEKLGPVLRHWLSFSGGMFFHAAVIYVFARSAGWVGRVAGSRLMVFLGEISFALYMVHYPLIYFAKQKYWFGSGSSIGYFAVLTLTLSVGVSAWLYYLVEVPAKAVLLKWFSGKSSPRQLVFECAFDPMLRLVQSPLIFALVLLIAAPVAVTKLYKRADRKSFTVDAIVSSTPDQFQPVSFGDQAELIAVDVVPRRDAMRINMVWRFTTPGTALASIHFSGTEFESRQQAVHCAPDVVGKPLVMSMNVYEGKYKSADSIQVSLCVNGNEAAPQSAEGSAVSLTGNKHTLYSKHQIEQGLKISRMPVLVR